jgi:peptidoglycan/LPS O-acetylase OafA/YrhL
MLEKGWVSMVATQMPLHSILGIKNALENLGAELAKSNRYTSIQFRPDIEGLRAIAVLLVVLRHTGLSFLQGGYIGVDVFFVLSGYLITSLLTKELNTSGTINLSRFYARRVRRLLPASTLVVLFVCLIQSIIASPLAQFGVLKAGLATILYSSNIYFAHIQLYYFAQSYATSPLLHTWSLAVEEQFYFVWPIFLLVLTRLVENFRIRILVLIAITLVSFAGCVWLTALNPVTAFFQSPPRSWEFGIGALASFVPVRCLTAHKVLSKWLGIAGLIILILSGALITDFASFPGYVAAIPVLATVATLLAGAGAPRSLVARLLNLRVLQYFGGISYSLYLWHWPVLVMAREIYPTNSAALPVAYIVLSVLLAAITHVTVENPVRFNSFLVSRSLLSLGIAGLSSVVCIGGFAIWWAALNHSTQFRKFYKVRNDVASLYGMGCGADWSDTRLRVCSFGKISKPESTVVLFGDSHAAQWFPALKDIVESRHWKLVTIIKSACSPMNISSSSVDNARAIKTCDQWRKLAITAIQEMQPDTVIISSSSRYPRHDSPELIDASEWEKGSRDTFIAIARQGTAVRLIRDTPHADYDVTSCLAQLAWNGHATCPPMTRASALSSDIYEAEVRAAANIANVRIIDMSDAICGRNSCEMEQGDLAVYQDGDHLTSSYAQSLTNALQNQLLGSLR